VPTNAVAEGRLADAGDGAVRSGQRAAAEVMAAS
jgi:hypothetical protein